MSVTNVCVGLSCKNVSFVDSSVIYSQGGSSEVLDRTVSIRTDPSTQLGR
jgi:hypothetical protein